MDREQFLLERRTGLGGSDISCLLGVNQYRSALDVYYEKVEGCHQQDNQILQRGRRLEKYILEEYAERSGETLETNLPMLIDSYYPFLIGHADAKIKDQNVIIEAKSTRFYMSHLKGMVTEHWRIQAAHYAAIVDAERVDIPVLFNNWEYGCFTYYRDEELEQRIREAAIDFWHNHIIPQIPPSPQSIKDIAREYPSNTENKEVQANDEIIQDIEQLATITNKISELEKKEADIKLKIMEYMRDAEKLNTPNGYSVLWKQTKQNRFDTNKFKLEHPNIYSEYLKSAEFRPLKLIRNNHDTENAFNL